QPALERSRFGRDIAHADDLHRRGPKIVAVACTTIIARSRAPWHFPFYTARNAVSRAQTAGRRARTGASSRHLKGSRLQEPVLVTGAAGFIGMHVARRLLADGHDVVGLDNLNAYYDPRLQQAPLAELQDVSHFEF